MHHNANRSNVSNFWGAPPLASHGYVVASLSHKYGTWDVFPAGGFALSRDWNDSEREGDENLANYLAADARYVLDRLAELDSDDPGRRFTGQLATDNWAIVGHSRGGTTVGRTCSTDTRVKACVVFDNVGPNVEQETGIAIPQLTIRSDHPRNWSEERVQGLREFLAKNRVSAWEAVIAGANHFSFSDLPIVDAAAYKSEIDPLLIHGLVSELTLAFLNVYLRDGKKPGWMMGQASLHPEVSIQRLAGQTVP